MFCPACGKENAPDQKFCRFCGFGLERVSQMVLEEGVGTDVSAELIRRRRIIDKLGSIGAVTFITGGLVFVGILIYTIISKFIIARGEVLPGVALLLLLVGAVLLLTYVIYTESQKDSAKRRKNPPASLSRAETTGPLLLDPKQEMMASITEQTTGLLETAQRQDETSR